MEAKAPQRDSCRAGSGLLPPFLFVAGRHGVEAHCAELHRLPRAASAFLVMPTLTQMESAAIDAEMNPQFPNQLHFPGPQLVARAS